MSHRIHAEVLLDMGASKERAQTIRCARVKDLPSRRVLVDWFGVSLSMIERSLNGLITLQTGICFKRMANRPILTK